MTPAETYLEQFGKIPERIFMLKGDSAGIGDILRSSAAWRALKNTFPKAELHLALFTYEPDYVSTSLIARHHLLHGFCVVDKRMCALRSWLRLSAWAEERAKTIRPDLVLDFESAGVYSTFVSWRMGRACGAVTVGIGEFPLRGAFYDVVAMRKAEFARQRGLEYPLEYSNRDFVCLSAINIERNGIPIELEETEEARIFRESLRERFNIPAGAMIIGLNIGCGTPGAFIKRPNLKLLLALVEELQKTHDAVVVLTGATFERDINQEFANLCPANVKSRLFDLAGKTSLLELAGLIRACDLFISSDSGPYHMAVALGVPTLATFWRRHHVHVHSQENVRCILLKNEEELASAIQAAAELLPRRNSLAAGAGLRAAVP